jgi:riboflavin synthase
MFTGIVTAVGRVVERRGGRFVIASAYPADGIALGASIAHDGCCLTVTALRPDGPGSIYELDVSNETLARTTLGDWQAGRQVNLERSLKAGDELGGHLVSGHVDAVGEIVAIREDGESRRFTFRVPDELAAFIAPKGSVALDGTSLTVNEVEGATFGVNLVPHTLTVTTWGRKQPGDRVNVEIDLLARYVARLVDARLAVRGSASVSSDPAPRTA